MEEQKETNAEPVQATIPPPVMVVPANILYPIYQPIPGVPLGLEALHVASGVGVHQQFNTLEMYLPVQMNNCYNVYNAMGQRIYVAAENTDGFERCCFGGNREYEVILFDGMGKEVLFISRERVCLGASCSGSIVTVSTYKDMIAIGRIVEEFDCCSPMYSIEDANGAIMAKIEGEAATRLAASFGDVQFVVTDKNTSNVIATITRSFRFVNWVTDSQDVFGVLFKTPMDVRLKALLLGAVICIDFNYFER